MRRYIRLSLWLTMSSILLAGCGPDKETTSKHERQAALNSATGTSYYALGQQVPITLSLERIALLTRNDVGESEVDDFADDFGLSVISHEPNLSILGTAEPEAREQLAGLARQMRESNTEFVRDAGLVVMKSESDPAPQQVINDEFVARFSPEVSAAEIQELNSSNDVQIVSEFPLSTNEFVLEVTEDSETDALAMSNQYHESSLTEYAHPDFYISVEQKALLNDTYFTDQWHHRNTTSSSSSVKDADVDATEAWNISQGSPNVTFAVIEASGFDHDHEDLKPNRWTNSAEKNGTTGVDDDQNGYVDDIHGLDGADSDHDPHPVPMSQACSAFTGIPCGPNHGTSVAGLAVAKGDNSKGVSGTCPDCSFLPIRLRKGTCQHFCTQNSTIAQLVNYASDQADVITSSWSDPCTNSSCRVSPVSTTVESAINKASANGDIVLWAAGNTQTNNFCTRNAYPSLTNVLAISGSDQSDKKGTYSSKLAFGECVDVLAPADNLWTTDREGTAGYPFTPSNSEDYNFKFSGTSGATPIVAGIAGIVRSINSNYSAQELRRIIRDTTDKIQPSAAEYSEETGKSNPTGGDATHGWGRVNAYEAAKVASDEVDIFVRDNRLDWGNTQQPSGTRFTAPARKFIPWWQSVDIKVDAPDSNGQYQSQPTASAAFESLTNEDPKSDETNHVYVRLRNRGPKAASNVKVTLYYAFAGTTLPRFSNLTKIGSQTVSTLPYSGPSVAGTNGDPAKIVQLDWKAPQPKIGQPNPNHFCLLAVIESQGDKPDSTSGPVANLVPNDNNITLDNVEVNGLQQTMSYERFYVRNPLEQSIETLLRIEKPQDWEATLDGANFDEPFELDPGEERSYTLTIESTETSGDVEVLQEQVKEGENWIMGGMTYRFDSEHTGD